MYKHGKAASWWFVPVVHTRGVVAPKLQLLQLKNTRTKSTQQCLNHNPKRKSNSRRHATDQSVQPATDPTIGPKPRYKPKPMQFKVEGYYEANGAMEFITSGDMIQMLLQCCIVMIHTSRLQYPITASLRTIGQSTYKAKASTNHSFIGTLKNTLKWAARLPNYCWIRLTRIDVKIHRPKLRMSDMELWDIALYCERMHTQCEVLSSEALWRLWTKTKHSTTIGVHRRNVAAIRKQLRARGITVTPDSEMVIKITHTAVANKREIKSILRGMLSLSHVYQVIARSILRIVRVVQETPKLLGATLDTTEFWMQSISQDTKLPCNCHLFKKYNFPTRHGHIFIPSWQYDGLFKKTIRTVMTSKVIGRRDAGSLLAAVYSSWRRYLPSGLIPDNYYYSPIEKEHTMSYSPPTDISYGRVRRCKTFLEDLVTMGIDKCGGRKLILCPELFEWFYDRTFPVVSDQEHFALVEEPLHEYSKWIYGI